MAALLEKAADIVDRSVGRAWVAGMLSFHRSVIWLLSAGRLVTQVETLTRHFHSNCRDLKSTQEAFVEQYGYVYCMVDAADAERGARTGRTVAAGETIARVLLPT
jgi:hypothetical protein